MAGGCCDHDALRSPGWTRTTRHLSRRCEEATRGQEFVIWSSGRRRWRWRRRRRKMSARRVHWLALLLSLSLLSYGEESARRTKRNLLFTPGGTYCQLITGVGVPIPLPHRSMTMGVVLKYNYDLPQNATELLQPYAWSLRGRRGQMPGRWAVYQGLEDALDSLDAGVDSHQCLLRTICEAAAVPFDPHSGLAAELVHILLTPSTSNEVQGSQPERDYAAAERSGRGGAEGCAPFRKGCPLPLLQMFSRLSALGAALG